MYTRDLKSACEQVAKGCKQCQTNVPKIQKAEGLLKGLPIPERLFDKVTADVFELGQIQEDVSTRGSQSMGFCSFKTATVATSRSSLATRSISPLKWLPSGLQVSG